MHRFSDIDVGETRFLAIGADSTLLLHLSDCMDDNGAHVESERTITLAVARPTAPQVDWIAVDIDSLGGIFCNFDRLRDLRDAFPGTPVILMSREFERNDYGTRRLSLGDVWLCIPFTVNSFEIGLLQARVNNQVWRARTVQHAMAQEQKPVRPALTLVANDGVRVATFWSQGLAPVEPKKGPASGLTQRADVPAGKSADRQINSPRRVFRGLSRIFYWTSA